MHKVANEQVMLTPAKPCPVCGNAFINVRYKKLTEYTMEFYAKCRCGETGPSVANLIPGRISQAKSFIVEGKRQALNAWNMYTATI
jgi:hypothetical protein